MSPYAAWSDYHAWPISSELIALAAQALPAEAHATLSAAAVATTGQPLYPREAVEAAALAMPEAAAMTWLEFVYALPPGDGRRLLRAMRLVHEGGAQ